MRDHRGFYISLFSLALSQMHISSLIFPRGSISIGDPWPSPSALSYIYPKCQNYWTPSLNFLIRKTKLGTRNLCYLSVVQVVFMCC